MPASLVLDLFSFLPGSLKELEHLSLFHIWLPWGKVVQKYFLLTFASAALEKYVTEVEQIRDKGLESDRPAGQRVNAHKCPCGPDNPPPPPPPQSLRNHLAVTQSQVPCDSFWRVSRGCECSMLLSVAQAWNPSFHTQHLCCQPGILSPVRSREWKVRKN